MKQQYLNQAKRLYDQSIPSEGIDSINISMDMEILILKECQFHHLSNSNAFIDGVLEFYEKNGALTDRQWYHVIKFWLRLNHNQWEPHQVPNNHSMPRSNKLKNMLDELKRMPSK
jgi:hypothetical protein